MAALGVAMKKATSLAAEQERHERKLEFALGKSADAVLKQASALQQSSIFGDEVIIQQQAYMAAIGLTEKQILSYTPVILDLASATGMSLESATKNATKTLSGMTGELGESVPQLRKLTQAQLRAGKGMEVMREMFKGMSEEEAKTLHGQLLQAQNAVGDLGEEFGNLIAPMTKAGASMVKDFSEKLKGALKFSDTIDWKATLQNFQDNTDVVATALIDMWKVYLDFLPDYWKMIWNMMKNIVFPIVKTIIVSIGTAFLEWSQTLWSPIVLEGEIMWEKIKKTFNIGFNKLAQLARIGLQPIVKIFNSLTGLTGMDEIELPKLKDSSALAKEYDTAIKLLEAKKGEAGFSFLDALTGGDNVQTFDDFFTAINKIAEEAGKKLIVINEEIQDSEDGSTETQKGFLATLKEKFKFLEYAEKKELAGIAKTTDAADVAMKKQLKNYIMEGTAGLIARIFNQFPLPLSAILAAGAGATVNAAIDRNMKAHFHTGGLVEGGENVPITAQGGEFVMQRSAVNRIGVDNLNNMNEGASPSVTVNISAPLVDETVTNSIIPAINNAIRRGEVLATG